MSGHRKQEAAFPSPLPRKSPPFYGLARDLSRRGVSAGRRLEQSVHRGFQHPGQAEGQGQGGVVFVVFDGIDGLAGNAAAVGQFLLGQTPGQAAVFYQDDVVVGSAWIEGSSV